MLETQARVLANEEINPGIHLLWLDVPGIARASKPGQFVMARGWPGSDPVLRRPLSVHRLGGPAGQPAERLAVLASGAGRGTGLLAQAQPGDTWSLLGPLGQGYRLLPETRRLLLVGGGLGMAPLAMLADYALARGCLVTLLLGASTASFLYPTGQLPPDVEVIAVTEDGSAGHRGRAPDLLPPYLAWADQICACGAWGMYASMAALLDRLEGKSVQVLAEVTAMGCGFGACLGCTVETVHGFKLACTHGPCFELRDLFPPGRDLAHPFL